MSSEWYILAVVGITVIVLAWLFPDIFAGSIDDEWDA